MVTGMIYEKSNVIDVSVMSRHHEKKKNWSIEVELYEVFVVTKCSHCQ